jgi:uncharacterized protein involved in exopolysaccharide biosynthesis
MQTQPFSASPVRWAIAIGVGFAIFLVVNITTTLVTFILPETFASTARILLTPGSQPATNAATTASALATQVELMKSEPVLGQAASELDLAEAWGKKYADGNRLHSSEVLELLRQRLEVRQVRNTSLVEVNVFSDAPEEAAKIANQIAVTYCATFGTNRAQIVDRATPSLSPVRPNKPLNVSLGVVAGLLLGGLAAAAVLFFTRAKLRAAPPPVP